MRGVYTVISSGSLIAPWVIVNRDLGMLEVDRYSNVYRAWELVNEWNENGAPESIKQLEIHLMSV